MRLKTILNKTCDFKGFVIGKSSFSSKRQLFRMNYSKNMWQNFKQASPCHLNDFFLYKILETRLWVNIKGDLNFIRRVSIVLA